MVLYWSPKKIVLQNDQEVPQKSKNIWVTGYTILVFPNRLYSVMKSVWQTQIWFRFSIINILIIRQVSACKRHGFLTDLKFIITIAAWAKSRIFLNDLRQSYRILLKMLMPEQTNADICRYTFTHSLHIQPHIESKRFQNVLDLKYLFLDIPLVADHHVGKFRVILWSTSG